MISSTPSSRKDIVVAALESANKANFKSLDRDENDERPLFPKPKMNQTLPIDGDKVVLQAGGVVKKPSSDDDIMHRSVLVVVAHPNDEALRGGESLLKEGHKVHVVAVSPKSSCGVAFR